ncbi:hypothetical protein GH714_028298 [Hevea brasiliensis]|uniref:Uncharacterized protein n=1 Tax=Hevea brasiliensis TaxID=3981 RepID=A0A6A6KXA2_HEVBR|nr:hypothetical protein GH714_028298 [Hevea brasiliensis]
MKRNKSISLLFFIFVIMVAFTMFAIIVEARKQHSKKSKPSKHLKGSANIPGPAQPLFLTVVLILPNRAFSIFCHLEPRVMEFLMILRYALLSAWKAACEVPGATVEIPAEFKFLVKPITLQGPCVPHLVLQIDGTLLAPPEWVHGLNPACFNGLTSSGCMTSVFKVLALSMVRLRLVESLSVYFIQALRFYASYNVTVQDIEIVNSHNAI